MTAMGVILLTAYLRGLLNKKIISWSIGERRMLDYQLWNPQENYTLGHQPPTCVYIHIVFTWVWRCEVAFGTQIIESYFKIYQ